MKITTKPLKIAFYISIFGLSVSGLVMLLSRFDDTSTMIFFCNIAFFFSMLAAYMNLKKTEQNDEQEGSDSE